jgi:hypothetical protein
MDAGGSKFYMARHCGDAGEGTICVVGDGRGNQEHRCHIISLQRAGAIGQFTSRPKQYPFWGTDRQPPAARFIGNAQGEVSSELWSGLSGLRREKVSARLAIQSVMRNSPPRECGPEPLMDKEVGWMCFHCDESYMVSSLGQRA